VSTKSNHSLATVVLNKKLAWVLSGTALLLNAQQLASAQTVLLPPPPTPLAPVVAQDELANNELNVFLPTGETRGSSLPSWLRYDPVNLRPHWDYGFQYGNGMLSSPGNQAKTITQSFSPGLGVELGRHWLLDYTPTLRFYSNKSFHDGVDHAVNLNGQTRYEDWTLGLTQTFSQTSDPQVQTATQTDQQTFGTGLSANLLLNERMSADFGLNQRINSTTGLQNSRDWSTSDWLNYLFWPRLNVGVGATVGYLDVDTGSNQTYEGLNARVNWRATDKLGFSVSGGVQDRQFLTGGANDLVSPIFSASIQYQPFKHTQIALTGSRSVGPSDYYTASDVSESTTVSASLNQRLLKEYNLGFSVTYTETKNTVASQTGAIGQTIDYTSFNATLSRGFLLHGTCSVTYSYTDTQSSTPGYSSRGNQIGFQLGWHY